jgi:hypothetical protein
MRILATAASERRERGSLRRRSISFAVISDEGVPGVLRAAEMDRFLAD